MNPMNPSEGSFAGENREDMLAALFAQLVLQQANMAMMLLGKVAHPETGEVVKDLEAAKLFIDQLEMLEAKTKGNLSKEEAGLLKQSLMSLRLAFVETIESPQSTSGESAPPTGAKPTEPLTAEPRPGVAPAPAEEHPKKFSKKY